MDPQPSTSKGKSGGGDGGQEEESEVEIVEEESSGSKRRSTKKNSKMTEEQVARLSNVCHLDSKVFSGHLMDTITDEVALEGLDGITLQALKVRLEKRPNFDIEDFEDVAPAIWNQMKYCNYFKFYILPTPRPDYVPYCWYEYRDDRGSAYEPLHAPEEIYLYNPIEDKGRGIRGSCVHYETRKDVTAIAKSCSYTQMIQLFGNRLVIVASQYMREKALLGLNYKKYANLTIVQYCIMERVGRARYYGEITRGKVSSSCMNIPPKTLFYMRKNLLKFGLVLKQSVSIKFENCRCPAGVTLFHLPRFYKRIESMASLNTRTVFSWLNNSETNSVPVEKVVSKYGKHTMRSLTTSFPTLLETGWEKVPVEDFNEGKKNAKPKTKTVRVLRLKITDVAVQSSLITKVMDKQVVDEADGTDASSQETQPEDKEEQLNVENASSFSDIQVLRPTHQYLYTSENHQLFVSLLRSGMAGLTLLEIASVMSFTPLEGRSAGRYLLRHHACTESWVKLFKQKANTYILNVLFGSSTDIVSTLQEKLIVRKAEIDRIRSVVDARERKQLEKRLKEAKKVQALRQKKAAMAQATDPDEASNEEEVPVKPSPKKKSKAKKGKSDPALVPKQTPELEPVPHPLLQQTDPSSEAVLKASNSQIAEAMSIIGLRVAQKLKSPTTSDSVAPRSHLVAVIPTRSSEDPQTAAGVHPESHSISNNQVSTEEEPFDDVFTDGYLDQEDKAAVSSKSEETSKDATKKPNRNRIGDSVDLQIRKRMIRQRVDWKSSEDRFILLAFIGSTLFISKYNYTRVFLFNSPQIRDLMLKKSSGKSNKTSAAIRRRVHFLLHQQARYEEYIALVGAVLRDDVLYDRLVKEYMPPPQPKIYLNPPSEALENVLDYLHDKFDSQEYVVPDARNDLSRINTLLFLRQLKRAEPYWHATMFALFCPMGYTSQSRGVFYRQWRNVNREIADDASNLIESGSNEPPFPSEAELTPALENNDELDDRKSSHDLYMDYCSKYLKFIAKQCTIMFQNLLMFGSLNLKGFQIVSFDMSTAHSTLSSCVRECLTESEVRLWTARCLVLDFVLSGDSSKLSEKAVLAKCKLPVDRAIKSLTRSRVLILSKRTGLLNVSRHNLRSFVNGLPSYSYDEVVDLLKYLNEATNIDSLACTNVGILHGIVEMTDYFRSSFGTVDSIFTLNDDLTALYDEITSLDEESGSGPTKTKEDVKKAPGKKRKRQKSTKAGAARAKKVKLTTVEDENEIDGMIDDYCFDDITETLPTRNQPPVGTKVGLEEGESYLCNSTANALRLLRIRLNEAAMNSNQSADFVGRDFFTLNLPNLEFVFESRATLNHKIAGKSHPFSIETLKELRKGLVELVYHRVPESGPFEAPDMEKYLGKYTCLFELINLGGVKGVSGIYLLTIFERKSLVKALKYLIGAKLIFSVGVAHRRFVTYNNINDWVIPIRPQAGSPVVGHAIMRPWLTSIGGLSWITVSRLFTSFLGQLQKPEVPFDELCQVFAPILSPVEATIMIEALAKLKYLIIYRVNIEETNLWSEPTVTDPSDIEYNADTLLDTKNVFVAISPYVTFLHSQLNHAIQKASKKQSMGEYSKIN